MRKGENCGSRLFALCIRLFTLLLFPFSVFPLPFFGGEKRLNFGEQQPRQRINFVLGYSSAVILGVLHSNRPPIDR